MEKKNYQKPAVQVINIGTVAIWLRQLRPFLSPSQKIMTT